VISDCRFPNEIDSIKSAGGKIIWVQRGHLPEWYDTAVEANAGSNIALNELKRLKIHASETSWVGTDFDAVIDNNATIGQLYTGIESLIAEFNQPQDHLVSK
jgi:hypothetical protein